MPFHMWSLLDTWCVIWCECQQGTFHVGNESYLLTSETSRRQQRRQADDDAATTTDDDYSYVAYRIQTRSTNYTGHSYASSLLASGLSTLITESGDFVARNGDFVASLKTATKSPVSVSGDKVAVLGDKVAAFSNKCGQAFSLPLHVLLTDPWKWQNW